MRISVIIFAAFLFSVKISAQSLETDARNNFNDKNYIIALEQYLKLIKKEKFNDLYNYRVGLCYLYTNNDKGLAVPYLEFCDSIKYAKESIDFDLGQAYFYAYKFDKAKERFEAFKKKYPGNKELMPDCERFLANCDNAKELMKNPLDVKFINTGENINSKRSDFNAFITDDESTMIFCSNKKYIPDFQTLVNSIYISSREAGEWTKPKTISNLTVNETGMCVGMSSNGSNILINDNSLFLSKKLKAKYGPIVELDKLYNKYKLSGACINNAEDTIYFSCLKNGGQGGFDLYYSVKKGKGDWGTPVNMGEGINTPYDEDYPSLSPDGKTLYFCSQGFNSMGGFDIFKCTRTADNNWSAPKNLGYPVNDVYDNKTISFSRSGRFAYVACPTIKEGYGDLDIYRIIFNNVPVSPVTWSGSIGSGDSLNIVPVEKDDTTFTANVYLKQENKLFSKLNFDRQTGKYSLTMMPGAYIIEIKSKLYETYRQEIFIFDEEHVSPLIHHNIYLNKIKPVRYY